MNHASKAERIKTKFVMLHLCNMKMSATSIRHRSKGKHYDIDGFISQLLASRKFDDLAEKLAEKAANRIMHIHAAQSPKERATDDNDVDNTTESTQEVNLNYSNRKDVNKHENTHLNNVKLRKDFSGKIDPQAVMNATISLSENLQLKYKYIKKNALEKKMKNNRDSLPKNDTKEDPTKQNKTTELMNFKDHNNKTEGRTFNQNATEKNQNDTKKESIDESKRSRDNKKDDNRKENFNRNSGLNESSHSGKDGETNDRSKKPNYSLEEQDPGHEQKIFHEVQNSGPEDKGIVEQEASHVDNGIREEKPSSMDEENQKHLTRSKETIIEEVEKTEENAIAQFKAREDNNVTSDYYPYRGVYRSKASDDSDDSSSEDRSTEDQSSKEQSNEDSNSSKFKPAIRKEGNNLYTYVRAPEYEDYHEKLAEWQKQHPENPADFMK